LTSIEIEHSMSDIGDWFAVFSINKNKNRNPTQTMTKHNTLITLCVLNNVLLTLTILLLPIISSFTIIHNTNTNNNNNLSSRLISLSSRRSSNLDTDDDDDTAAVSVDNNKYKGLIQKYQRRSHLLEEALIKERNVTRKFRTRVKLLEQKQLLLLWNNNKNDDDSSSSSKLFEAASVVHLIDNEKEVELNDRSDQRQRYYRRLEIQEEEFNRMLKEKTVLLNQLSKLKLQLNFN